MSCRLTLGILAFMLSTRVLGCTQSHDIVRGQSPSTVGFVHGDNGVETQKTNWLNSPNYTEIRHYAGPGGGDEVRYKTGYGMTVDAQGNPLPATMVGCQNGGHPSCDPTGGCP